MRPRLVSTLFASFLLTGAGLYAFPYHFEFSNGQAMGFLGDEGVYGGKWCEYVENFFYTRHPEKRMIFYNAGCKNDTVFDALERLDQDVLERKLDYCLVMLGTWDGDFQDFDATRFHTYQENMRLLLDRLRRARCYPLLVSPPMFDWQTRQRRMADESYRFRLKTMSPNYNGVMGYFGAWLREEAYQREMRFVDTWGPLNAITAEARKTNVEFSLIPDAIHPDAGGSAVVAAAIIATLAPERDNLGSVKLQFVGGDHGWSSRGTTGGYISQLSGSTKHLSFIWKPRALPWVMPGDASIGVELAKIDEQFNREMLHLVGLAPGDYQLFVAGQRVGDKFSHTELAHGLELHKLWDRPQFKRAQTVANMNATRYQTAIRPLRDLWQEVKRVRVNFPGDQAQLDEKLKELTPRMNAYRLKSRELADKIYAAAKPLGRNFEIRKIYSSSELRQIQEAKRIADEAKKKAEAEKAKESP